jgi:hypothetical protein
MRPISLVGDVPNRAMTPKCIKRKAKYRSAEQQGGEQDKLMTGGQRTEQALQLSYVSNWADGQRIGPLGIEGSKEAWRGEDRREWQQRASDDATWSLKLFMIHKLCTNPDALCNLDIYHYVLQVGP